MMKQLRNRFPSVFDWLGNMDLLVLLAVLAVVAGIWGFLELADAVRSGETLTFDEKLLRSLRDPANPNHTIGPVWLEEVGRDLTALGGVAVLFLVTAAVAGYLWLSRKHHALVFVLTATLGGLLLSTLLKEFFARSRPTVVPYQAQVYTSSFPSGHSMLSAVVYLTLGALLARLVERRLKIFFLSFAMLITFLVGISRVFMGVHYPSDVLAGWTAGLVWALLCWLAARYLQSRGAVEQETE